MIWSLPTISSSMAGPRLPFLRIRTAILFKENGIDLKGKHACDVGELAGVPFEAAKHTALADARGIAAGFVALIRRGAPNLFLSDGAVSPSA